MFNNFSSLKEYSFLDIAAVSGANRSSRDYHYLKWPIPTAFGFPLRHTKDYNLSKSQVLFNTVLIMFPVLLFFFAFFSIFSSTPIIPFVLSPFFTLIVGCWFNYFIETTSFLKIDTISKWENGLEQACSIEERIYKLRHLRTKTQNKALYQYVDEVLEIHIALYNNYLNVIRNIPRIMDVSISNKDNEAKDMIRNQFNILNSQAGESIGLFETVISMVSKDTAVNSFTSRALITDQTLQIEKAKINQEQYVKALTEIFDNYMPQLTTGEEILASLNSVDKKDEEYQSSIDPYLNEASLKVYYRSRFPRASDETLDDLIHKAIQKDKEISEDLFCLECGALNESVPKLLVGTDLDINSRCVHCDSSLRLKKTTNKPTQKKKENPSKNKTNIFYG